VATRIFKNAFPPPIEMIARQYFTAQPLPDEFLIHIEQPQVRTNLTTKAQQMILA
jgi:hypothetical protein